MKSSNYLISLMIIGLISVRTGVAQNWRNYEIGGRGVPFFISASSQTAIIATDGFTTDPCCYSVVTIDAVDLSTGYSRNLEQIGPTANLYSAVEFNNGMAVSFRDNNQNSFRMRHYPFSGVPTEITPPGSTQFSPLASDGVTLYVVDSGTQTLLKLAGVGESWEVVASGSGYFSSEPRRRGVVLPDGRIFWPQQYIGFNLFTPPDTFSMVATPPGYIMLGALQATAKGDTVYAVLKNAATGGPAVWEIQPNGASVIYNDSSGSVGSFQEYHAAFVDGDNLIFGGVFSTDNVYSKLLQFNFATGQFSEFSPQFWWVDTYRQICDITKTDSLLVAWEYRSYIELAKLNTDSKPPLISGLLAPGTTLWPPNKKFVTVATVTAEDFESGLGWFDVYVWSNEPSDPKNPDFIITGSGLGPRTIQLRADRLGTGTGRFYTLATYAVDLAGNWATAQAIVSVPHDQRK